MLITFMPGTRLAAVRTHYAANRMSHPEGILTVVDSCPRICSRSWAGSMSDGIRKW